MPHSTLKLILVADTARARILEVQGLKITKVIEELEISKLLGHHERQEKRQGRFSNSANPSHFFDPQTSPKDKDRHDTAALLVQHITSMIEQNHAYKELIIIAAPKVLGHIRQCLNPHVKALITKEIPKDLTHQDLEAIQQAAFS